MKKNIVVITGGYSKEHEISLKSGKTVFNNIDKMFYNVYMLIVNKKKWIIQTEEGKSYPISKKKFTCLINDVEIKFDLVFNMIHGSPGEDGIIQKYFDKLNIPYTGPSSDVAQLTFNKSNSIDFARKINIKTAKSILINKDSNISFYNIEKDLGLPLFVKANNSGSSFGISKVYTIKDLEIAIKKSFHFDDEVLIEQFLNGKEVSVGVMYFNGKIKVFGITEITSSNDFFDYEAKYHGKSEEITPAILNKIQKEKVEKITKELYKKFKMKGFSRVDFIIIENEPYFLEINSIPGMSDESIFPKQVLMNNISLKNLFSYMIEDTLKNFKK